MNVIFNKVLLKKIDPQHRSFIGVDNYREKFEKNVKWIETNCSGKLVDKATTVDNYT